MNVTEAHRLLREQLDNHGLYHVEAKMNGRLTRAFGRYRYNTLYNNRSVELSIPLVKINDEERVMKTILHEIAHALTEGHGHDRVWQAKLLEIGGDGKRCYDRTDTNVIETRRSSKLYKLVCQECGADKFGRYRRRMNGYMHPHCGGKLESVELE